MYFNIFVGKPGYYITKLMIDCFRIAIPPIIMCFSLGSVFGSGLIFATGVIYGMMALGKK